jgi:hypothetical protein
MPGELIEVPRPPLYICASQSQASRIKLLQFEAEKIAPFNSDAAIRYADFDLFLMPDADSRPEFAQLAGKLAALGSVVHVLNMSQPCEFETAEQLADLAFIRVERPTPPYKKVKGPKLGGASETLREQWRSLGLEIGHNGSPHNNIDNALRAMTGSNLPMWFDRFLLRCMTEWFCEEREFADHDYAALTVWMQRDLGIHNMSMRAVTSAADMYLRQNERNCAQDWLGSLAWDGVNRLDHLLREGFGTPDTTYYSAVGRCFIMGIANRILAPGCQVDLVPVFEGAQGIRKSTALRTLGGRWFSELHTSISEKDFLQELQGVMLGEFSELSALSKSDRAKLDGIISNRVDRYRASFGRLAGNYPRMCAFAGTTNTDDWNKSDVGARRWLPVVCGEIDIQWLKDSREQLFAEAAARLKLGESYWDVPADEAARMVDERRSGDAWDDIIARYCDAHGEVTIEEIISGCLEIEKGRATNGDAARVRSVLRTMGWRQQETTRNKRSVRLWKPANYASAKLAILNAPPAKAPLPIATPEPLAKEFESDCPF